MDMTTVEEALRAKTGAFKQWAADQWHDAKEAIHVVLREAVPKLEKVRKLMSLLPPGVNICGFRTLRRDGVPISEAYSDLRNLKGFCLRRGHTMFDYGDGKKKLMGFITLIGTVDDPQSGHVYFGNADWLDLPHIPVIPSGVGRRYDIFETRRPHLTFVEEHHPGVLDMVIDMFQRSVDDQLDAAFDSPRLRVVVPSSKRAMRLWLDDPLFKDHLAIVVNTGSWALPSALDTFVANRSQITVESHGEAIHVTSDSAEGTIDRDEERHGIEQEIKRIFHANVTADIEPMFPVGGPREVAAYTPLWRPRGVVPVAKETTAQTIERIKNLGVDACESDRRFKFICYWAALTTMIQAGPVETLDGRFISAISPPRVCAMEHPVVFMTYGREGALHQAPQRDNIREEVSDAQWERVREKWHGDTLLLQDYGSPAAAILKDRREAEQNRKRGPVKFRTAAEVVSPAAGI
jgi:hypothetical protein